MNVTANAALTGELAIESHRSLRNIGIDILRGLSVILVIIHHLAVLIPVEAGVFSGLMPKWFISGLSHSGKEAVFIFFVISGFLITSRVIARRGSLREISTKEFYLRRAARILPCLLILVSVLSTLHLLGIKEFVILNPKQSLWGAISSALGFHLNWYEGKTGYLPLNWDVLWSLSIEEAFYLGFPLLCLLIRNEFTLLFALLVFGASLPWLRDAIHSNEIWQEKAFLPGMAAIASGISAAIIATKLRIEKIWVWRCLKILGWTGVLAVVFLNSLLWPIMGSYLLLFLTLSTQILLIALFWGELQSSAGKHFGFKWLSSFGILSYEIYLTHMFVIWTFVHFFYALGGHQNLGLLWFAPAIFASWFLGYLVARYISVPLNQFFISRN